MKEKVVIFDFDGVIADTERAKFDFLKERLAKEKIVLDENHFSLIVGKKTGSFLKELFPKLSKKTIKEIEETRRLKEGNSEIEIIKNSKKLIEYLYKKNYVLAITTGSKRKFVEKLLKKFGLTDYFSLIVCGEDFEKSKPSPEGFLLTLKKLDKKTAIIIEDSPAGAEAGKKAGCKVYGIKTNVNNIPFADKTFDDSHSLLEFFKYNL